MAIVFPEYKKCFSVTAKNEECFSLKDLESKNVSWSWGNIFFNYNDNTKLNRSPLSDKTKSKVNFCSVGK